MLLCACAGGRSGSDYEFVVVGAGAGGGPLASRLARAGYRVLLLEAGSEVGGKLEYQVPAMHAVTTEDPDMAWWYWVEHHADPAIDQLDSKITPQGILYPRGTGIGGSTAVNAMVTVLPSHADWNDLAEATGQGSYRAPLMMEYWDRVQEWLPVSYADQKVAAGDSRVIDFLVSAVQEVAGTEVDNDALTDPNAHSAAEVASALTNLFSADLNRSFVAGEPTGVFRIPTAVEDGQRRSTRELILDTVDQGFPLTVQTESYVTRVLWDDDADTPTAIGVEYARGKHLYAASLGEKGKASAPQQALASREVVLSAGTFNTPQLLMLSGVGEAAHLQQMGIDVVVDRPGVGRNLQDRYEAAVVAELDANIASIEDCRLGQGDDEDPCLDDYFAGEGPYRTNGFAATALVRSSPELPLSDLQVFAFPADARGYYPGYSSDALAQTNRFSWLILKGHTDNDDGRVSLRSADPFEQPRILFNQYDEADPLNDPDMLAMVEGVKIIRRITEGARQRDASGYIDEIWPGPDVQTDTEIAEFIRRESWGHHACCTNPMGQQGDEMAVLDSRFRVRGTDNLRVVDASVFPKIPGTFIAVPIFMMSERAADLMIEDAK